MVDILFATYCMLSKTYFLFSFPGYLIMVSLYSNYRHLIWKFSNSSEVSLLLPQRGFRSLSYTCLQRDLELFKGLFISKNRNYLIYLVCQKIHCYMYIWEIKLWLKYGFIISKKENLKLGCMIKIKPCWALENTYNSQVWNSRFLVSWKGIYIK